MWSKNLKSKQEALGRFLAELAEREVAVKRQKRIERLLKQAKLPRLKSLKEFDVSRIPGLSPSFVQRLATGDFIDRHENILFLVIQGRGKLIYPSPLLSSGAY